MDLELFLNIFIIVCMFIIGSLFGSFFSLATYRIPRRQDIVATRSYCPTCKHRLNFFDLIPVLSYIFCLGKCRYCGEKISLRYFLLEIINGVIFVLMYLVLGYNLKLVIAILIYAILFVIIGSYIMSKKMTDEEKKEVVELKLSKKRGVFISEIVVGMIAFSIFLATALVLTRNYTTNSVYTIANANAYNFALNSIEIALVSDYDELEDFTLNQTIDNIVYTSNVTIEKYSETGNDIEDIVKKINVKVNYTVNGENKEVSLNTLKGKVL